LQPRANLKVPGASDEEFRTGRTPISAEVSDVKTRVRFFLLGIVLGALMALPLGINVGRDAPLLSNPFGARELKDQVVERVKETTSTALEDARETIHEATKPLAQAK
jgi:hypothetical protein